MFVKNLMVVGKLFTILISLLLISCGTTTDNKYNSKSAYLSAEDNYHSGAHAVTLASNFLKYKFFSLSKEDKKKQQQAIFYALDNLPEGEIIRWHNEDNNSWGRVKIVSSYPQGSGYCRIIFSQISKKGKIRDFKETACKDVAYDGWLFIVNRS